MKYWGVVALFLFLAVLIVHTHTAFAHFPATDKAMTVVMHIDPNDQPVANQPAKLSFIYYDELEKFSSQNCNCRLTIYQQGKQQFSGLVNPENGNSLYGGSLAYTFQKPLSYTIKLAGKPKRSGEFTPFNVSWAIGVMTNPNAAPSDEKYYIIGFIAIAVICVSIIGSVIFLDIRKE